MDFNFNLSLQDQVDFCSQNILPFFEFDFFSLVFRNKKARTDVLKEYRTYLKEKHNQTLSLRFIKHNGKVIKTGNSLIYANVSDRKCFAKNKKDVNWVCLQLEFPGSQALHFLSFYKTKPKAFWREKVKSFSRIDIRLDPTFVGGKFKGHLEFAELQA